MFGLFPLSGAAFGDVGNNEIALEPTNVTTQNPVVGAATVSQNNELSLVYTPNAPIIPSLSVFEDENFAPPNVLTGSVRIDAAPVTINNNLIFDLNLAAPVVGTTSVSQEYNFIPSAVPSAITRIVTVVNSGGNKYAIDGVIAPALTLYQGVTYTFDVSDSSVSNHPLAFKDAGGNSLTTGVTVNGTAGTSGATVVIVVPTSGTMPASYYCTVHGVAMGNSIVTQANDNISTQNPIIPNSFVTETVQIIGNNVVAQNPIIGTAQATTENQIDPTITFNPPIIDQGLLTQIESINFSLTLSAPVIGEFRFPFMEESIPSKVYSEIIIPPETWTDAP